MLTSRAANGHATMKLLLALTAVLEATVGAALLVAPVLVVSILLGDVPHAAASLVVARVAGGALLSLGLACWSASGDVGSRAARGVVAAILLYSTSIVALFVYSAVGPRVSGVGLWPAAALHVMLAVWCIACLAAPGGTARDAFVGQAPRHLPRHP